MKKVSAWEESSKGWNDRDGGYNGRIGDFVLTMALPTSGRRDAYGTLEKLRVVDAKNNLVLAVYHTDEISSKFGELQKARKEAQKRGVDFQVQNSIKRVEALLRK